MIDIDRLNRDIAQSCRMAERLTAPRAIPLNSVKGVKFWRFTVEVKQSGLTGRGDLWERVERCKVIAPSAQDALDLIVKDTAGIRLHPTEFVTWGPRGGRKERFRGWHSTIGDALFSGRGRNEWVQMVFPQWRKK